MAEAPRSDERVIRGIPVSAGVCRGKILSLGRSQDSVPRRSITEADVPLQIQKLQEALIHTRQQILEVQKKVMEGLGAEDAGIFDAHLLVLEDPTLIEEVIRRVQKDHINVEAAFHDSADRYISTLKSIDDDYLRERAADIKDVTERILSVLLGREHGFDLRQLKEPCILISYDLTPSTTAVLDKSKVLGFATDIGSKTSHTAIMARSLRIPAVVGLQNASLELPSGTDALLDGYNGLIIINPSDQTLFEYGQLVRKHVNFQEKLQDIWDKPAITLDGRRIILSANVEQTTDTEAVKTSGAEGVGLFRTEYLFINRTSLPTEEEQYKAYRQVAAALKPSPVVIRTLDLGGDKFISQMEVPNEMNPFLGWRAIRFCLQERDIFRSQLKAILRASVEGNIKMMYPMVSGLEELVQANALLDSCRAELKSSGIPFDENMEVGVMIEIPAAVMAADMLAKRVKFLSIGTNDLIQYALAVDRLNEKIAHLYEPTHPAIVRLIKLTVESAHRNGIWVGVCGEMAGDPVLVPLLLGLGVDELSAASPVVPQVKYLIRRLKLSDAQELARFALECESGTAILTRCQELARSVAPGLFET